MNPGPGCRLSFLFLWIQFSFLHRDTWLYSAITGTSLYRSSLGFAQKASIKTNEFMKSGKLVTSNFDCEVEREPATKYEWVSFYLKIWNELFLVSAAGLSEISYDCEKNSHLQIKLSCLLDFNMTSGQIIRNCALCFQLIYLWSLWQLFLYDCVCDKNIFSLEQITYDIFSVCVTKISDGWHI